MEKSKSKPPLFVVDSSVMVKWLNAKEEKLLEKSNKVISDFQKGKIKIIAPELAKYEVGNALLYKGIGQEAAKISLEKFFLIPVEYIPWDQNLANMTMEIAYEAKITYYDASFVALAKQEDAVLLTDNPKHQSKIIGVKVVPLEKYT